MEILRGTRKIKKQTIKQAKKWHPLNDILGAFYLCKLFTDTVEIIVDFICGYNFLLLYCLCGNGSNIIFINFPFSSFPSTVLTEKLLATTSISSKPKGTA